MGKEDDKYPRVYTNQRLVRSVSNTFPKPVMCNETGQVFKSGVEAAKQMGLSASSISSHLSERRGYKTVRGYTFKFVTP
jgi:hypothetical protein